MNRRDNIQRSWDWVLLGVLAGLLIIGFLIVYSATFDESGRHWQKQLLFAGMGLVAMAGLYLVPPRFFYAAAYPLYVLSLFPLLYIILFKANSVERWIALPGGFNLQPSELTKVAFLMAMARLLSFQPVSLARPKTLLAPVLLFIVPFALVLKEPNLSTALSFVAMTGMMVFFAGLSVRDLFLLVSPVLSVALTFNHLAWALMFMVLIAVMWLTRTNLKAVVFLILINIAAGYGSMFVWNKVLYAHQRDRILTFVEPQRDPQGAGYQVLQSKVAIGSGRLLGKGYLHGTQTNLSFLPEEHTDFIFSVLGEQFGFLGCVSILALYLILLFRILRIAVDSHSRFTALTAVGLVGILSFHVLVNISMTVGMMPVTGLPLPFLSYGGSFLISCLMMLGIVLNLRSHGEYL
jgi:rod shape determining protein RodA